MKVSQNSLGPNVHNTSVAKLKEKEWDSSSEGINNNSKVSKDWGDSVKVNVSDRAQAFQRAKEIAGRQEVDEAKVARLQKLIDEGNYKTDSSAIADRLVDEHLSFPD